MTATIKQAPATTETLEQQYRVQVIATTMGEEPDDDIIREHLYQTSGTKVQHDTLVYQVHQRYCAHLRTLEQPAAQETINELANQRQAVVAKCDERWRKLSKQLEEVLYPVGDFDAEHTAELQQLKAVVDAAQAGRETLASTAGHAVDQRIAELQERSRQLSQSMYSPVPYTLHRDVAKKVTAPDHSEELSEITRQVEELQASKQDWQCFGLEV